MADDILQRFSTALPGVRQWIEDRLIEHAPRARAVSTLGFNRLPLYFPAGLLERAKVVCVPRVPFPPLDRLGLPELAAHQQMPFDGITFVDTFFLRVGENSESLHFHELVHVVQWDTLGVDKFILAYGFGLARFGYEQSPLEQMAYILQRAFDEDSIVQRQNVVSVIQSATAEIWKQVAPAFELAGVR